MKLRSRRRDEDDEEEESFKSKLKKRRAKDEDDEEEDEDDEDQPSSRRKSKRDDDEEEDEPPRSKRRRRDEDDDEEDEADRNLRKMKDMKGSGDSRYYEPGNYRIKIYLNKKARSEKTDDTWWWGEHKVIESDNSRIKPGEILSWGENITGQWYRGALGRLKTYLYLAQRSLCLEAGAEPLGEDELDDDFIRDAWKKNSLEGAILDVHVFPKKNKAKTGEFNRCRFSVPEELEDAAEEEDEEERPRKKRRAA